MRYEYFEKMYDSVYKKTTFDKNDKLRIERFKRISSQIGRAVKVLDFGGGDGDLNTYLSKTCKYSIADLSSEHEIDSFDRISLKDGSRLDVVDGEFDVVVMSEVLEHIPNCYDTLSEISRVLKPKGRLIITVPNPFSLLNIIKAVFGFHLDPSKEHLYWFDWSYLSNLLGIPGSLCNNTQISHFFHTISAYEQRITPDHRFPLYASPRSHGTMEGQWGHA